MTTSAAAMSSVARIVSRPGSPGPVPTNATDPVWRDTGIGWSTRAEVTPLEVLAAAVFGIFSFTVLLVGGWDVDC